MTMAFVNCSATCMLYWTHRSGKLWGEVRGARRWLLGVAETMVLHSTATQSGTPLTIDVAPNRYKVTRPASASVEDKDTDIVRREVGT